MGIAIDSAGNAYVTGATMSQDFPVSQSAPQPRLKGYGGQPVKPCCNAPIWTTGDAFIAKLDPTGSQLVFSSYLGGSLDDIAFGIALDPSNNVYVGGCTLSSDFPTTQGVLQRNFGGTDPQNYFQNTGDGFIAKLDASGNTFSYVTYFGGNGDDCVSAIAVDSSGNAYVTGASGHLTAWERLLGSRSLNYAWLFRPSLRGRAALGPDAFVNRS